ncbi:transposase family protein [Micromonospora fulviviridis]|uniref:transposase family protein n=1 Tax=Micromonospora fulviviridis TaxID=47860 RepID=UPI0037A304A5
MLPGVRAASSPGQAVGHDRPGDLPVGGRPVRLRWRKRRWYCPTAGCPRTSFTEQVGQVPARSRLTTRLRQAAGAAVADAGRTIVQAARDHCLSCPAGRACSPRSRAAPPLRSPAG